MPKVQQLLRQLAAECHAILVFLKTVANVEVGCPQP